MRIPSAAVDRLVFFVARDVTDLFTRETGLTSFTVYYCIDDGSATTMTSPTTAEKDSTNMPGVYSLLIDESGMTTLAAGHDTEELVLHITHASMTPVIRRVEIYRPETTEGVTLDVAATGEAGLDFNNIKVAGSAKTLTNITVPTTTAVTNGVSLVNDAITSAKYDESSAFPVKAADTGSTYIARTGADSDTLETLSDEIALVQTSSARLE